MPLEIRELHIKVSVNQPPAEGAAAPAQQGAANAGDAKEDIILQCVDEVMEIINNKKER